MSVIYRYSIPLCLVVGSLVWAAAIGVGLLIFT